MSWVIILGDLGLIAYLTMRAYVDGMSCLSFMLCGYHSFYSRCGDVAVRRGSVVEELGNVMGRGPKERRRIRLMRVVFTMHELDEELTTNLADTLDRYEVPFFGPLASRFVDDE